MLIEREHQIKKVYKWDLFVEREQGKQKKLKQKNAPRPSGRFSVG